MTGGVRQAPTGRPPKPTKAEKSLARKFSTLAVAGGPPYCAVASDWVAAWCSFAQDRGEAPGPINNAPLIIAACCGGPDAAKDPDAGVSWVDENVWRVLYGLYGGGPKLERDSQEIFSQVSPSDPDDCDLPELVRSLVDCLAARCRRLWLDTTAAAAQAQADAEEEAQQQRQREDRRRPCCLAPSLGRKPPRDEAPDCDAEWARLHACVEGCLGADELIPALVALKDAGCKADMSGLRVLADALSAQEVAYVVASCLCNALGDADRVELETWLEQASALGFAAHVTRVPLLERLEQHLQELREREQRSLQEDAHDPAAQLWRVAVAALEADDEETLQDLLAEGNASLLDADLVETMLEALRRRRRIAERRRRAVEEEEAQQRMRTASARDNMPHWNRPETWTSTEDYMNAWRRKKWEEAASRGEEPQCQPFWKTEEQEQQEEDERFEQEARRRLHEERDRRHAESRRQADDGAQLRKALATLALPADLLPTMPELRKAYRAAALRAHPDRPHNRARQREATAEFQGIKDAFDLVSQHVQQ